MKVITRFPPSPTGFLHIGGARTALFNYLYTKKNHGEFLLRFEDTDTERSDKKFEEDIIDGLKWLNILPDNIFGNIPRQSEKTEIYKKHLKKLIDDGYGYEAEKAQKGTGNVIRFKNPNTEVKFTDTIRGEIGVNTKDLGDFIIARDINNPLYHLAVVVDDWDEKITDVIRGEEHISNTPRQVLLIKALGFDIPRYTHLPLILGKDKKKLSKRTGTTSITEYVEEGYLQPAFINFLVLLGWHPKKDREFLEVTSDMESLIEEFDIKQVQKSGAVFDIDKLRWLNKKYSEKESDDDFYEKLTRKFNMKTNEEKERLKRLTPTLKERSSVLSDIKTDDLSYIVSVSDYSPENLFWKDTPKEKTRKHLENILNIINNDTYEDKDTGALEAKILEYATKEGKGEVLWPLRYAIVGRDKSPDPFTLIKVFGKKEIAKRVKMSIEKCQ